MEEIGVSPDLIKKLKAKTVGAEKVALVGEVADQLKRDGVLKDDGPLMGNYGHH
jgi:hypothetical protein